ncbi:MAG: 4-hydroxythreonine-4-phosphate dehydrogenase PdxA [Alphaproteobacteria bacterium]|nr:4-hydroxythreonine-4-phosphate dehydrogenase PdxA [Alphaproteobacteria bacterium]
MGDPAGIGPEIIVRALADYPKTWPCRFIVIGDVGRLTDAVRLCGTGQSLLAAKHPYEASAQPDVIMCYDLGLAMADMPYGQLSALAGECAYRAVVVAAQWAMQSEIAALVTAPLNKAALHMAGHKYPGHTEMLAALTGVDEVSLMMARPDLVVIHVTMHLGLLDAIALIEPGLVYRTIARGHAALCAAGIARPRIAVCGVNPHAGENGLFGDGEEEKKIIPALTRAQAEGWDVSGPHPADTLFYRARRGDFDLVVAMYHDQGLGPIKVLGIDEAVNVTVGLPVIRTSVAHGTAFDIAGRGQADARGMVAAIQQAVRLAQRHEVD